jgi:sulfate adenylyltransferase (ADP) / ATP adenylyltransferase
MTGLLLEPGTLWPAILCATEHGLASGALQPIETDQEVVEEAGVGFLVRKVSSLARKDEDKAKRKKKAVKSGIKVNPFLPHDEDLFVADISETHFGLLNKFNVIDHHLLIVTRHFEDQETLLTLADFRALAACMGEFEGLGFYNGGVVAGASQPHKHLQMVPLPMAESGPAVPIEPLLPAAAGDAIATVPGLPFRHAFCRAPASFEATHALYRAMLHTVGVGGTERQSAPYNLLLTRRWMLVVPRSREFLGTVSINGLGYAGSLFVRGEADMGMVREVGPMEVLRHVSVEG